MAILYGLAARCLFGVVFLHKAKQGRWLCVVSTHKSLPHQRTAHWFTVKSLRHGQSLISSPSHGYCDAFFEGNLFESFCIQETRWTRVEWWTQPWTQGNRVVNIVPPPGRYISLVIRVPPPGKHICPVIRVPPPGKHMSLVICIAPNGRHISLVIRVPPNGKHISLVICVPPNGKHISLVICVSSAWKHISLVICVPPPRKHMSLGICVPHLGNTYP